MEEDMTTALPLDEGPETSEPPLPEEAAEAEPGDKNNDEVGPDETDGDD